MSDIAEVGILNSQTLNDAVAELKDVRCFLHTDIHISFHSTYIDIPETNLKLSYDMMDWCWS